jgi:alpha-tubulin suppressor-like RCC1 family protein
MPTRSVSQRWRTPIALIVLALLFACLKGRSPTDGSANEVRFDLAAQVSGGSVLHITVVYLDQPTNSETLVPVILLDQRINVAAGTQSLPLTIDLTRCLADPLHLSGSTCELEAGVVLEQNGQAVDSVGVGPIAVTPGQTVNANASLVPVGSVIVYPATASLTVGAVTVLGDSVYSPTHAYLPNTAVTWTSTNTNIAKVNASGAVTGVGAGTTTVTASAGGQSGFATITVTGVTTGAGTIVINAPIGVSFSAPAGAGLPLNAPISVTSSDTAVLTGLTASIAYTAGQPTGWLIANMSDSVSQLLGQRVSGRISVKDIRRQTSGSGIVTPAVLDLVPSTTNLAAGSYSAVVTVSGTNATSASVTVTYSISGPPPADTIAITPSSAPFSATAGGSLPGSDYLSITSTNASKQVGNLVATITPSSATAWLAANVSDSSFGSVVAKHPHGFRAQSIRRQTSGSGVSTPATLHVNPTTTSLAAGTYTATVTVTGDSGASAVATVSYTIAAPAPVLAITPNPVTFSQYAYGSTIASLQTVTATNTGTGTLGPLSAIGKITYTGADTGWITVTAASATTATGQPKTTSLHLGSDTASIPVSATGATNNPVTLTAIVSTYVTYTKVVLGASFGCGLTTAATVYCWGGDGEGELGDGGADLGVLVPVRANIPYSATNPVIDIEAGSFHACALQQSGAVYCWGRNDKGQLGVTVTTTPIATPTLISGHTYQMISLGSLHSCGVEGTPSNRFANYLDCWGDNTDAEFGNNATNNLPTYAPVMVQYNAYYSVSAGNLYTCAITAATGGSLYCWGNDQFAQLGNGTTGGNFTGPILVNLAVGAPSPPVPVSVSAGNTTTCATDANGNGYCWGDNTYGQTGNGVTGTTVLSPTLIPGSHSWTSISVGSNSVCGIASTADYCWGFNGEGQLGNGTSGTAGTPTPAAVIGSGALFTEFVVGQGSQSACYITSGVVYCFGNDGNGQLGIGPPVFSAMPNPTAMVAQPAPAGVGPARVVPRRPVVTRRQ